jgi:hypothetical protein
MTWKEIGTSRQEGKCYRSIRIGAINGLTVPEDMQSRLCVGVVPVRHMEIAHIPPKFAGG